MKSKARIARTQPRTNQSSRGNKAIVPAHRPPIVDLVRRRTDSRWRADVEVASSFTAQFSFGCSRMDLIRPKKLIGSEGVDCYRNNKEQHFDYGNFWRTVAEQ